MSRRMAEWSDRAICLGLSRFGETGAIMDVFGRASGRRRGLVYGGASRKRRASLQPGNTVAVTWRARVAESLGHFSIAETEVERASGLLDAPGGLSAASALAELLLTSLPEGEPKPRLFDAAETVLDALGEADLWPALFVRWELGLLQETGYGLDLSCCALTGAQEGLAYVSPRSGRAVCASAAGEWADRLLPLPGFLLDAASPAGPDDVGSGFRLTGYFLERRLYSDLNRPSPETRDVMIDRLEREGRVSGRLR